MMIRFFAGLLSSSGVSGRLLILMYHRVLSEPDPLLPDIIDVTAFDAQMSSLARNFNVLGLADASRRLKNGTLPARSIVVTFDDGYRDNHDVALPVLKKYGLTATFFIASGYLDGGWMWNDRIQEAVRSSVRNEIDLTDIGLGVHAVGSVGEKRSTIDKLIGWLKYEPGTRRQELVDAICSLTGCEFPESPMMSSGEVVTMHDAGMEIGCHTVSHPILVNIEPEVAEHEIIACKERLEGLTGGRIVLFAYPNGRPGRDYSRVHVDILERSGIECAVSTSWGCATAGSDNYQLPRIAPWDRSISGFNLRLLRAYRQNQAEYV
jgi:peptidoglycan/xylan/chitin deacetylase (PgdA/CDA1 family)